MVTVAIKALRMQSIVNIYQEASLCVIAAICSWLLFPKQSVAGPSPHRSISHQYFSPDRRCQKSLKKQPKQMYVVVVKLRVFSTHGYLAFACAAVVSVVIPASKAVTAKPAGCTKPQIPRDFADTPRLGSHQGCELGQRSRAISSSEGPSVPKDGLSQSPFLHGCRRRMLSWLLCNRGGSVFAWGRRMSCRKAI